MWHSAVLTIGIELSLRIVHYDFKRGVGDLCKILGHYFLFLLLCVIFLEGNKLCKNSF